MSFGRAVTLVATLLAASLFAAPGAAAQTDPAGNEQFAALVAQANTQDPIYGPATAFLVPDRSSASALFVDVSVTDPVIHFEAEAPNTSPGQEWGVIVAFRQGEDSHSVSLWSNGTWIFFAHGADQPREGTFPFAGTAGSVMSVDIAVTGDTAYVGANGELVSDFDISSFSGPGGVMIASALTGDYSESVGTMAVTNATVWDLGATASPAAATTEVAEPVASDDSYTSPTYGYTIPLGDWVIDGSVSQDDVDLVRLVNEPLSAFVMSFESIETPTACINNMFGIIEGRQGYSDVALDSEIETEGASAFAVISYTYLDENGQLIDERDRVTCWQLNESGAMVRLDVLVQPGDTLTNLSTIVDLEDAVGNAVLSAQSGRTEEPLTTPAPAATTDPTPTPEARSQTTPTPAAAVETTPTPAFSIDTTPTQAAAVETTSTPATATGISGLGPSGMSYTSPTYGYSLSWDEAFTVAEESSDPSGDYLGLSSDTGVFIDLIGETWTGAQTSCFDWLVSYYEGDPDYSNIFPAADPVSTDPELWDSTGLIFMNYTSPEDGATTRLANHVSCSEIPDQGALVTLEQVATLAEFGQQLPLMNSIRQAFGPAPSTGAQAATATPEQSPVAASTTGYTSPSFGYTLSWDDSWSVVEETSDPAGDYVRITNGPVYADLLSEPWDTGSSGSCFDLVVNFYTDSADYADVRGVEDSASLMPGTWDSTGVMAMTYLDTDDGEPLPLINYVSCTIDQAQGIVISLEQFVEPASAPGQIEIMNALREGFAQE